METEVHVLEPTVGEEGNAKTEPARFTEVLLEVLCHDVAVVIRELRASGLDPGLFPDGPETAGESGSDCPKSAGDSMIVSPTTPAAASCRPSSGSGP